MDREVLSAQPRDQELERVAPKGQVMAMDLKRLRPYLMHVAEAVERLDSKAGRDFLPISSLLAEAIANAKGGEGAQVI
jgi:hypothetical protein